jgi:hypothetical protein
MKFSGIILTIAVLSAIAFSGSSSANEEVKLSNSGICHDTTSPFYKRTKNYKPFSSLSDCLDAGGRLPRNANTNSLSQMDRAISEANSQGRKYSSTYNREDYPHWLDVDGNCQNTRQDLLQQRSSVPVTFTNSRRCTVKTGKWYDPYSGNTYTLASDIDVDHIVSLAYSFPRGSKNWTRAQKAAFANDPENLLLVDDGINQAKSAKGPTEWMPPRQEYRCEFLGRFDYIMKKYNLIYFAKEKRVIDKMKQSCGMNS